MGSERLQKVLAAAGVTSRRGAEAMIAAGRVTVDGKKAAPGTQVDPEKAIIAVDGQIIGSAAAQAYLLLHKPAGVTSTTRDPHADTHAAPAPRSTRHVHDHSRLQRRHATQRCRPGHGV